MIAIAKNRPHSVNHIFCAKIPTGGNNCISRGKPANFAHNCSAFFEDCRAPCMMYCAIYAASTKERRVGGIHNRIGCFAREIGGPDNLNDLPVSQLKAHRIM